MPPVSVSMMRPSSGGRREASTDAAAHRMVPVLSSLCPAAAVRMAANTPPFVLRFMSVTSRLAFVERPVGRASGQQLFMGAHGGFSALHKDDLRHLREVV